MVLLHLFQKSWLIAAAWHSDPAWPAADPQAIRAKFRQLQAAGESLWLCQNQRLSHDFPIVSHMAVCQNLVPLVNIKIAGKWMFIPLKMVLIGIDPYPYIAAEWFGSFQTNPKLLDLGICFFLFDGMFSFFCRRMAEFTMYSHGAYDAVCSVNIETSWYHYIILWDNHY